MRNQRNTQFEGMNKLWSAGLQEKNRLLKEWVTSGENPDKIEATLAFEFEQKHKETDLQEELTVEQMRKEGIPEIFG